MKLAILLVGALMLAGLVPKSVPAQDPPAIAPINPVPEIRSPAAKEVVIENPGEDFNGQGFLERIEDDKMVIGDMLLEVSPLATYFKKSTGFPALKDEFVPGVWVGYYLDENRVIISLWLFPAPPS
jgi:hypothetical protein